MEFVCTNPACKHELSAEREDLAPRRCPECRRLTVEEKGEAERAAFDARMRGEYDLDLF